MNEDAGRLVGGRYRLGGVLGRGGMGTVWRADDEMLGRTVAVKELRLPSSVDDDERQRLVTRTLREAKAIARIRSGSAVTVFDVVNEDERPWIVMELVEGRSLADHIRQDGPLGPQRAAEVGLAVLDVLRAAHREGILHRDVKPSNVLLEEGTGRVVLTDFGIAKVEGDPSVTSTGMLVGAPSYISPERARGKPPGPPADLWSLGGLLYAAVEGKPPYDEGSALSTLTAVMTEPFPEPVHAGGLTEAIYGLLAKDPELRLDVVGARALLEPVAAGEKGGGVTAVAAAPESPEDGGPAVAPPVAAVSEAPEKQQPAVSDRSPEAGSPKAGTSLSLSRRFSQRTLTVAAVVVAAVLVLAGAAALTTGDETGGGSARGKSGGSTSAGHGGSADDGSAGEKAESAAEKQKEETGEPADDAAEKSPAPPADDAGDEGGHKPGNALPDGYKKVVDDKFHFSVGLPEGWQPSGTAGRDSGRKYAGPNSGLPKIQIDFNPSPLDDAASAWRDLEPAVKSGSTDYRRISLKDVAWRGYPTVADWQFTRKENGTKVRVLNRGFKVDASHGYAIMITCKASEWPDKQCKQLRRTAFESFAPRD